MPRVSSDGKKVALVGHGDQGADLLVWSMERQTPMQLTSGLDISLPAWAPGGDRVLYSDALGNVWSLAPDGTGEPESVLEPEFGAGSPRKLFSGDDLGTNLDSPHNYYGSVYDVGPRGLRFIVIQGSWRGRSEVVLVRNWARDFAHRTESL